MANQDTIREGQKVTLLKHGLQFDATVTAVNDDGSINVLAMSKFGSLFPQSRVERTTVVPVPEHAGNTAYWTNASPAAEA